MLISVFFSNGTMFEMEASSANENDGLIVLKSLSKTSKRFLDDFNPVEENEEYFELVKGVSLPNGVARGKRGRVFLVGLL